ncbi:MAG: phage Gp37/Gp68 family protein [Pseudomonadota bacterium]
MSGSSAIEWTDATWNPVHGCTKLSAGCRNCYAETFSERFRGVSGHPFEHGFDLRLLPEKLDLPLRWQRPRMIFVNSMSDLFHEDVPTPFVERVFATMASAHWHTFQVLTKRSARLRQLAPDLPWPANVWMGVSVEREDCLGRVGDLLAVPAAVRFLSLEPLLGPLPDLPLAGIDWVIVGGESGPHARPMDPSWVRDIRRQCEHEGVPFFFKQWGGTNKKRAGRLLDGRTWDGVPEAASAK